MAAYNARVIEKDCFTLSSTEHGDSEVIDLNGASKFSCQAVYDVQAPSAKTFDDGAVSTLIVQDLTYSAVDRGVAGDDITIQYVGDGVAGAETVDVTDTAIVVHMDATVIVGSTADDIFAAVQASIPASDLVDVVVSGTGATVQAVAAATPLAGGVDSEVIVADSTFSIPTHGFTTGLKIRLTTTGTLPAPFLTGTDYFVIVVDADTVQLAASLDDALAGTAITIVDEGSDSGVGTLTAVALAGASVTFQKSNDGENWVNIQSATSITVDGSVLISQPDVSYRYFKAVKALTAGVVDLAAFVLVIGDAT
jgi:hypothetical protein